MSQSVARQLARVLEAPHLDRIVPTLAPETLRHIIRHCGLDACTDIIALATPAQLTAVLDGDVWHQAHAGRDDEFDAARFGEWLEVLTEADAALAARTLAALDQPLVVAGLSAFVRVFDPAAVMPYTSLDGEEVGADAIRDSAMSGEVGGYLVEAIRPDSWDAIVALLVALAADWPDRFHATMHACRLQSNSVPEVDGLDDLLTAPDQLMHEVAEDRDVRRSRHGYAAAADARAFLHMARHPRAAAPDSSAPNPIAVAYFRAADEGPREVATPPAPPPQGLLASPAAAQDVHEALHAIADLLSDAGVVPDRPLALLTGGATQDDGLTHVRSLLGRLSLTDPASFHARHQELAFLANTLIAGCSLGARPFTPQEASAASVAVCNLGLDSAATGRRDTPVDPSRLEHDLVCAFEVGWRVLHAQVSMSTAAALIDVLAKVPAGDTDTQAGLHALRRALLAHHAAGTPWGAQQALDVIAILDMVAWTGLLGLLAECPVMPAVVDATLDGRKGAVSATDFAFISTMAQVRRVHAFLARLPELLGR